MHSTVRVRHTQLGALSKLLLQGRGAWMQKLQSFHITILFHAQKERTRAIGLDLHMMGGREVIKAVLFIIYLARVEAWPVQRYQLGGKREWIVVWQTNAVMV